MLISIDNGNYAVKTPNFSFINGITEHSVEPPLADELLEYKGAFYTLSSTRMPYMRDKTRDDRCFVLSLFAIGKELEKAQASSNRIIVDLVL